MSIRAIVENEGFAVLPEILSAAECDRLIAGIGTSSLTRTKAGVRHVMRHPAIAALARIERLLTIAQELLGDNALAFRATLFDKSPQANWLVVWHQDTALPLRERRDAPGWGPWSVKDGVVYAHAPAAALSQVLALRIHLDDSNIDNGPLRVLPGTHKCGVLRDEAIEKLTSTIDPMACVVNRGGIVAMRPLLVHASSKSQSEMPRRVLHIEYAASLRLDLEMALAIV